MIAHETRIKATHLYLDIQRHFANGGGALSFRDIGRMVGTSSSATSQYYINILERWGVIKRIHGRVRTIVLTQSPPNYPPVEWRQDMRKVQP